MVCVICLEMAENVRLTGSTKLEQIKIDEAIEIIKQFTS